MIMHQKPEGDKIIRLNNMTREGENNLLLMTERQWQMADTIRNDCEAYKRRVTYFLAFYAILLGLFYGYMNSLMYFHIDRDKPRLTGINSALGFSPGLSIVPRTNMFGSIIHIRTNKLESTDGFTSEFLAFLTPYEHILRSLAMSQCARNDGTYRFDPKRPCAFDLGFGHPCNVDVNYGYESSSPCILLKMNKIYGWLPDPIDGATGVVVKCEGITKDDQFNLGNVSYYDLEHLYSARGWKVRNEGKANNGTFHADFYPFLNQRSYLQPIVWVVFKNVKLDTFIRAQCYLVAKNIHVNLATGEGSIQFGLLVE